MTQKKVALITILVLLIILIILSFIIKIPYTINSHGIVLPLKEWTLTKVSDGNLLYVKKNNLTNNISNYAIKEFQRGDAVEFNLVDGISDKDFVRKGDTIGYINSNELQRRLLDLKGQLEEQRYLLQVYKTGEKPEDVTLAKNKVVLAKQELETREKIFNRVLQLYKDTLIADKDYEEAYNAYKVKQYNYDIALAGLNAIITGAKREQIDYVKSQINTLEAHIEQLRKRIDAYTIVSPISGIVIRQKGNNGDNSLIFKVADISQMLVVLPVEFYEINYISFGQEVELSFNALRTKPVARIVSIDNTIQMLNRRQSVFVTAALENPPENILMNMMVESKIKCDLITPREYLKRTMQTIYEN